MISGSVHHQRIPGYYGSSILPVQLAEVNVQLFQYQRIRAGRIFAGRKGDCLCQVLIQPKGDFPPLL